MYTGNKFITVILLGTHVQTAACWTISLDYKGFNLKIETRKMYI